MDKKVRVRFAPSPTGALHVGGVRTALYNYLLARKTGGDFILRIEDTDQTRYVPGAEEYIIEALQWCGIDPDFGPHKGGPDAPYRQSERKATYRQYAERLIANKKAYYAFDTEEELEAMRARMKAGGNQAPQYNAVTREYMKNSLTLPADEVERRLSSGEPYVIRLVVPRKEEVRFHDEIRGWVNVHTSQIDDKVLLKSDGMPTYHLANVVDDRLMQISHVIRGEEWLPSAPLHILLYRAFEWEPPLMAHLPLLLSPDGNGKLSKRDGDKYGFPIFPLRWTDPNTGVVSSGYREEGYLPEGFMNFLALLGWNPGNDEELLSIEEMVQKFSLERVGKSGVRFDKKKSIWFNQTYIRKKPDETFLPALKADITKEGLALFSDEKLLRIISLLKERVEYLTDFLKHGIYFFVAPETFDPATAQKRLTPEIINGFSSLAESITADTSDWSPVAAEAIVHRFADGAGLAVGKLAPALRLVLSNMNFGPGVFDIMDVLGKDESVARLRYAHSVLQPQTVS